VGPSSPVAGDWNNNMKDNWQIAIDFVIKMEGEEYENDSKDTGGETKFGISKRAYPNLDIKNLTKEQAVEIYKKDYWETVDGDNIYSPMDICMFNCAVNCGVGIAKRLYTNNDWKDFLIAQIRYYRKCETAKFFLNDWIVRTIELWKLIHYEILKDWKKEGVI